VATTLPSISNSAYALRTIVDVRVEDEITLELPYLLLSDYTLVTNSIGYVTINVLNDLRAPESCAQSIAVQVFYQAGDDFEFAVPSAFAAGSTAYMPQMDQTEILHGMKQGMTLGEHVPGGHSINNDELFHAPRCIGEKILSIKQLLLRNSVIQGFGSQWTFSGKVGYELVPDFIAGSVMAITTGNMNTCAIGGDLLSYLAPMYAFRRGAVRVTHTDFKNTDKAPVRIGNYPGVYTQSTFTQPIQALTHVQNLFYLQSNNTVANTNIWPSEPVNFVDISNATMQHLPYYNEFPIALNLLNYQDQIYTDVSQPASLVAVIEENNMSNVLLQRAVSDDFQLMFFIGCPPLATTYT